MRRTGAGVVVVALVAVLVPRAHAQQHAVGTKLFFLKQTPSGQRTMRWMVKDGPGGSPAVVGDPTQSGAALFLSVQFSLQCFDLPAAGWSASGPLGFKYKNTGAGAIKVASIKKTPSGIFTIKAKASSTTGPLDLAPSASGGVFQGYLLIRGGDVYCTGPGANGLVPSDDRYRVKNLPPSFSGCVQLPSATLCSPSGAFLE